MTFLRHLKSRLADQRIARAIRRNTMVDADRIQNLARLAQRVEDEQIPGDVVECGVYKGGTAALLARTVTHSRLPRTLWLFDVFNGMPAATSDDGAEATSWVGNLKSSAPRVERLLRRTGADLSRVRIVPGLFQETFPSVHIPQIALLNLDADWYESVRLCLETFYDAVVPRGFISIDDYGAWPGCRLAVDEFFRARSLSFPLHPVNPAHWFQKS
ncbi:MAG TPA: TylF/MycF/NovP-related O-methyltransferase [Candidatus Dormibacteraeota bacterium]|nr:TylF/MycF/NovP-related O-methyltransferase [Candidatus Dormibacteraeota bacterium]